VLSSPQRSHAPATKGTSSTSAHTSPGPIFEAIAQQFPTLKGTVFAVEEDNQFGLAGLIADGAYTGIEVPVSRELRFIARESTSYDEVCSKSSQALVELHSNQSSSLEVANHDADGKTRVQQAWTAICSRIAPEFASRYGFRTDVDAYLERLADPFDSAEDDVGSASHQAFFEAEGRFQTEADQRLMSMIGHTLESELFVRSREDGTATWDREVRQLATGLDEKDLAEWAAHAMYRPGVTLDLTTTATQQASFATYAMMMRRQVLQYLAGQP